MGTPAEDAAYQRALTSYRVWCQSVGQQPDPGYLEQLAQKYNQGLHAPGMGPATPQPAAPVVPGGGAPAIPAAPEATPTGQAPGSWDDLRAMFPNVSDQEWQGIVTALESMGLNYQTGFAWVELAVQTGASVYIAELVHEVGMASTEASQLSAEAAMLNAKTNELYSLGMLEEAKLSREQELLMSRELNELNKYVAEMQNQVSTLGLQIQERAYGAQLGAHPVNTVEFELWKRAGGSVEPVEIPEAPVPVAPKVPAAAASTAVPTAPVAPTAPTIPGAQRGLEVFSPKGRVPVRTPASQTAQAGELHTIGEEGWEYMRPGPGTVVAPKAKGEAKPTQAGGQRAISQQVASVNAYRPPTLTSRPRGPAPPRPHPGGPYRATDRQLGVQGKRTPYGWMRRRAALGFQGGTVPGAQGGYVDPGTHTDEEMAAAFASAMKGWPSLYNPGLGGVGIFGETIPSPGQVSRRQYYGMDPSGHEMLKSHLASGFETAEYGQVGGESLVMDWLRQMQRSWIPGLEGAKKAVSYAY